MATSVGRSLIIQLNANTDGFSKGILSAEKKLVGLEKKTRAAGKAGAIAFAGLSYAALDFAKAAAADQASSAQLARQLKTTTNATKAQTNAVEGFITQASLANGIADDQLRPAFAQLVRVTKDVEQSQRLLNLAMDISAGTGKDLSAVTQALSRAAGGNVAALKKLGVPMDANIVKAKDSEAAFKALEASFNGAAKTAAESSQGSFARLTVAIDETKETLGYGLLPFVKSLADSLQTATPFVVQHATVITRLGVAIASASAATAAFNFGLKILVPTIKYGTIAIAALRTGFLVLTAAMGSNKAMQTLVYMTYTRGTLGMKLYNAAVALGAARLKVITAAQWLWNAALSANPIGLTVLAVAALAAGFVLAYKKIKPFRDLINSIWEKVKALGSAIKNSVIGKTVTAAFNAVTGKASGGQVQAGRTFLVGERGPELFTAGQQGYITPTHRLNNAGAGVTNNYTINLNGIVDAESARRSIERVLQQSSRRTGAVAVNGATL